MYVSVTWSMNVLMLEAQSWVSCNSPVSSSGQWVLNILHYMDSHSQLDKEVVCSCYKSANLYNTPIPCSLERVSVSSLTMLLHWKAETCIFKFKAFFSKICTNVDLKLYCSYSTKYTWLIFLPGLRDFYKADLHQQTPARQLPYKGCTFSLILMKWNSIHVKAVALSRVR